MLIVLFLLTIYIVKQPEAETHFLLFSMDRFWNKNLNYNLVQTVSTPGKGKQSFFTHNVIMFDWNLTYLVLFGLISLLCYE